MDGWMDGNGVRIDDVHSFEAQFMHKSISSEFSCGVVYTQMSWQAVISNVVNIMF